MQSSPLGKPNFQEFFYEGGFLLSGGWGFGSREAFWLHCGYTVITTTHHMGASTMEGCDPKICLFLLLDVKSFLMQSSVSLISGHHKSVVSHK